MVYVFLFSTANKDLYVSIFRSDMQQTKMAVSF